VTPIRDEADLLHELALVVRSQEHRPVRWVIVDDGSRDRSLELVARLAARDPWIVCVTVPPGDGDGDGPTGPERYAANLVHGFRTLFEVLEADHLEVDYVANLDADIRPPPALFAELIERSERDRSIGIASCRLGTTDAEGRFATQLRHPCGAPRSGLRLWRTECLQQAGLYPVPSWASVTGVRARNRGWRTVVHEDLAAEVVRRDAARGGWWTAFRRLGAGAWFVGAHPLTIAMQAVVVSAHERDLRGLALVAGYVESAARGRRRSTDPELLEFYGNDLPRRQWASAVAKIMRPLKRPLRG
jgi:GT2 family glycosyltransferase